MARQLKRAAYPVSGASCWSPDGLPVYRGGGQAWWHAKAVQALDFSGQRGKRGPSELPLASCVALTRGSTAMMTDVSGTYQTFATDKLACVAGIGANFHGAFTNKIRNPRGEGASIGVAGSGGALPTYWAVVAACGLSTEIVSTGTEQGLPYIDLRFFGVANTTSSFRLCFDASTNATAAAGQGWGADFSVKAVAGTQVPLQLSLVEYNGATPAGSVSAQSAAAAAGASRTVHAAKGVLSGATTNNLRAMLDMPVTSGTAYDLTLRLYALKLVSVGTLLGPELIINSDFANAGTWSLTSATISSGVMNVSGSGFVNLASQGVDVGPVGSVYRAGFSIASLSSPGSGLRISVGGGNGTVFSVVGPKVDWVQSTTSSNKTYIQCLAGTTTATIDDVSVRMALPGYLPDFPILPLVGVTGDSTRAADNAATATFDWFAGFGLDAGATELAAVSFSHMTDGVSRSLFELSDGTANNYVLGYVNVSDRVALRIVAGGVVQTDTALTAAISLAPKFYGFGWSAAGGYVTNGNETVTFAGVTLPVLTQKHIGGAVNSNAFNDCLVQLQSCTLLTQAEAAAWALPH